MAIRISFDLEDKDLKYFRQQMKKAKEVAGHYSESEIIEKTKAIVAGIGSASVPQFVRQRLESLQVLVDMLADKEWALADKERQNVLSALAYFAEPEDIIPDHVPVLGFIDDAIMIELVMKELKPEFDAFSDFCRYRREEASRNRSADISRKDYLAAKQRELHSRMRRRRRSAGSGSGAHRTRLRLF